MSEDDACAIATSMKGDQMKEIIRVAMGKPPEPQQGNASAPAAT